jgi:NDP-sugar pyrophosphorylase family protein
MKCIIYCNKKGTEWIGQYFADADPYMLRIGNKPLLEFFIEFCVLSKIKDIHIVQTNDSNEVENYFRDGSKWDINLKYLTIDDEMEMEEILRSKEDDFSGESLLVFNGFFFLNYKKKHIEDKFLQNEESWNHTIASGQGLLYFDHFTSYKQIKNLKTFSHKHFLQAKKLDSIKTYYELNMDMVSGAAKNFIMPSYNSEQGVFIGQNVEIMYSCEITKPIILGDNIQLKKNSHIGPGAIIGSNSLIDSYTSIKNSIVYRNSYIGTKLEINNKIIYKRRLIDPDTGAVIDIVDDFLLAEVHGDLISVLANWIIEVLFALVLMIIQLPFYVLIRPFCKISYKRMEVWKDKSGFHKIRLKRVVFKEQNRANKLFSKLSLDKFHLLPLCLNRKLRLVGCALRPVNRESLKKIRELKNYYPAVFSFSDMCGYSHEDENCQVEELFYVKHATLRFNIAIFFKSLILNFFGIVNVRKN